MTAIANPIRVSKIATVEAESNLMDATKRLDMVIIKPTSENRERVNENSVDKFWGPGKHDHGGQILHFSRLQLVLRCEHIEVRKCDYRHHSLVEVLQHVRQQKVFVVGFK